MLEWPLLLSSFPSSFVSLRNRWVVQPTNGKANVSKRQSWSCWQRACGRAAHWSLRFCWWWACADVPSEAAFSAWTGMNLKYLQRLSYQWQFATVWPSFLSLCTPGSSDTALSLYVGRILEVRRVNWIFVLRNCCSLLEDQPLSIDVVKCLLAFEALVLMVQKHRGLIIKNLCF